MPDYGMGRVPSPPDARDRNFPMRSMLTTEPLPRYKYWTPGAILDQGSTPHCVGFSWAQWLATSPVRTRSGNARGHDIYAACKLIDGIPHLDGSYVRAGAKVMQDRTHLASYLWANSADELMRWVLTKGPVVVGTAWHEAMFDPGADGVMKPDGAIVGGHAWLLTGYSVARAQYRVVNSWGRNWGQSGKAWIDARHMWQLIDDSGEAVTAAEQAT